MWCWILNQKGIREAHEMLFIMILSQRVENGRTSSDHMRSAFKNDNRNLELLLTWKQTAKHLLGVRIDSNFWKSFPVQNRLAKNHWFWLKSELFVKQNLVGKFPNRWAWGFNKRFARSVQEIMPKFIVATSQHVACPVSHWLCDATRASDMRWAST